MVMKCFRTCGISNALDGTEDDKLYNEEGQEIDDDEDNEFRLRAKARVTQMASKLYCQLKALYKTVPLGATDSIKVK